MWRRYGKEKGTRVDAGEDREEVFKRSNKTYRSPGKRGVGRKGEGKVGEMIKVRRREMQEVIREMREEIKEQGGELKRKMEKMRREFREQEKRWKKERKERVLRI